MNDTNADVQELIQNPTETVWTPAASLQGHEMFVPVNKRNEGPKASVW